MSEIHHGSSKMRDHLAFENHFYETYSLVATFDFCLQLTLNLVQFALWAQCFIVI